MVTFLSNYLFILGTKPVTFWTNIKNLGISTVHEESLQTVKLDGKYDLRIEERIKKHGFDLESLAGKKKEGGLYKLESPNNDLIVSGNGYFAFSEEAFFNPQIMKSVDLNTLENLDNIHYILTTCPQAKTEGDWLVAESTFDPKDINIEGDKLYFSLDVPELAKYGGELEIDYLEIMVKTKGILEKGTKEKQVELTPMPAPSASPSAMVKGAGKGSSLLIRVLNGGAEEGAAGKFAKVLQEDGFSNTLADNADNFDYSGASIKYRAEDEEAMKKVTDLLRKGYKSVSQTEVSTSSAEMVVVMGSK